MRGFAPRNGGRASINLGVLVVLVLSAALLLAFAVPAFASTDAYRTAAAIAASTNKESDKVIAADLYKNLSAAEKQEIVAGLSQVNPEMKAIVQRVNGTLLGLGTLLAVLNIVWQGFRIMDGDSQTTQQAKKSALKSLIGIGVMVFAWTLVGLVVNMVGGI